VFFFGDQINQNEKKKKSKWKKNEKKNQEIFEFGFLNWF